MASGDSEERLAVAAERIADALEFLVRNVSTQGPSPRLKIARAPSDVSRMESVTLRAEEGLMMATVQNVGDAETVVERPVARLGSVEVVGELIGRDSRPHASMAIPGAPDGPGVVVQFQFDRGAHVLGDLPLTLLLPHRPGRFPFPAVLEVQLAPSGQADGRFQWHVTDSRELRDTNAAP